MSNKLKQSRTPRRPSKAVNEMLKGFEEYAAHRRGEKNGTLVYRFSSVPKHADVQAIRKKLDMTQAEFTAFGFSLSAIRHWEAKRRTPEGAARVLLKVIEKHPKLVLDLLHK